MRRASAVDFFLVLAASIDPLSTSRTQNFCDWHVMTFVAILAPLRAWCYDVTYLDTWHEWKAAAAEGGQRVRSAVALYREISKPTLFKPVGQVKNPSGWPTIALLGMCSESTVKAFLKSCFQIRLRNRHRQPYKILEFWACQRIFSTSWSYWFCGPRTVHRGNVERITFHRY